MGNEFLKQYLRTIKNNSAGDTATLILMVLKKFSVCKSSNKLFGLVPLPKSPKSSSLSDSSLFQSSCSLWFSVAQRSICKKQVYYYQW